MLLIWWTKEGNGHKSMTHSENGAFSICGSSLASNPSHKPSIGTTALDRTSDRTRRGPLPRVKPRSFHEGTLSHSKSQDSRNPSPEGLSYLRRREDIRKGIVCSTSSGRRLFVPLHREGGLHFHSHSMHKIHLLIHNCNRKWAILEDGFKSFSRRYVAR